MIYGAFHLSLAGAVAILIGAGLLVAIWQVLITQSNERKRNQPIVIAHEDRGRSFDALAGGWTVEAHATNEGAGPAFNVRWGVSYFGVRYAFRMEDDDPFPGNRQRVVHPRGSFPPEGATRIVIPSVELIAGEAVPEDDAFYWARYENAQGRTWETINRPARDADLRIRRVYFVGLRERWETRKRRRYQEKGRARDDKMRDELLAVREQGKAGEPD